MGNINSTRWRNYTKRRTVEECRRITPPECRHVGAATTTTPVGRGAARRLWCLCECGARALYLYQLPEGGAFHCRRCRQLSYRSAQMKGTRAAFAAWLTPARWEHFSRTHPATLELQEKIHKLYQEHVAPYNWERCNVARRAELLQIYASPEVVERIFEKQRWKWSRQVEPMIQAVGAKIRDELWTWWKSQYRSAKRKEYSTAADSEIY